MVSIKPVNGATADLPGSVSTNSTRDLATGNWRTYKPLYVTRPSPCNLDCPAGTDVRAFLSAAAAGDVEGAWRTIRRANPFPGVCGRVCYHPCESQCNRAGFDEAVAIHAVERAIAAEARRLRLDPEPTAVDQSRRIGVVGAGPAGLSCAYHLARRGYGVTVYDERLEPGGMLRYGIPAYRLPRATLDAEIGLLRRMGITFVNGVRIGKTNGAPDLTAYAAIFLASGAQRSRAAKIPGENLRGVMSGLDMLRQVNGGVGMPFIGKAVIVGGGNTALDAARVALRLGAEPTIVYRRAREDMPAHPDEIAQAEAEGVSFTFHAAPIRLIEKYGRVAEVECQRMRPGEPDASGRRRPEPIPGATFTIPADHVLTAIGEEVEVEALHAFAASTDGRLRADDRGRTSKRAVFAGGDAATGAGTVVEAIGSGRRAAEAMDAYLHGQPLPEDAPAERVGPEALNLFYFRHSPRAILRTRDTRQATRTFDEVVRGLAWHQAVSEAERCFTCGSCSSCDNCYVFCPDVAVVRDPARAHYEVDFTHCKGCGICAAECPRGAIALVPEEQR